MTYLTEYIEDQGAILSGELAKYMAKVEKIKDSTARKRIQRLSSPIHKLTGLFSEKQSLVYHSDNYNNELFFEKLKEAFEVAAKRCSAVVDAIDYHHGIISKEDLANYTFSPITKIKGHLKYSTLIEKLKNTYVLSDYNEDHYQLHRHLSKHPEPNFRHYKAIQFTKNLVGYQFAKWSSNIGLCSFRKGEKNYVVGGFQFSFTAPSYISGLVQYKNSVPKPGFIVADILIGNSTELKHVEFFIQKINAVKGSNPTIKLFPALIVDGVEITALNKLKQAGILIASIKELFGENYTQLLKELINTITNAGAVLKKDPESYLKLMGQLTKLVEGKTYNLRGDLFELAVGYYYGKLSKYIEVGKRISIEMNSELKTKEIDVLAVYESEVRAVECKGYTNTIDEEYISTYLSEKIPVQRKWLEKSFPNRHFTFEIWSTGGFSEGAMNILEAAKSRTKKYKIDYLNKEAILKRARELQGSKFIDILKEYYFKDL